jgi:AcrR family transcriptional regulator
MAELSKRSMSGKTGQAGARERIVQAAIREFSENGQAGSRVDRIASESGVNKAMIYYYFSSKENLYRQVVKELFSARLTALRRSLEGRESMEAAIKQILDTHSEFVLDRPEVIKILLRELANPNSEIVEMIGGMLRESGLPGEFARRLTKGVERGEHRPVNVRQAVISLVSMSIGYYLLSPMFAKVLQTGHLPTFIEERKAAIADLFMNGVKAR